jgi:hypothetical protein
MDDTWKTIIWQQMGAAIDALENALRACPDDVWSDPAKFEKTLHGQQLEYWYIVFHTLFWLDFYLAESTNGFAPPPPFGLEELDPAGLLPPRVYAKSELLAYLEHCRRKCRKTIAEMTDQREQQRYVFGKIDVGFPELLLYTMRHVQHHAAQLNLMLRQSISSAPGWTFIAKQKLLDA